MERARLLQMPEIKQINSKKVVNTFTVSNEKKKSVKLKIIQNI
jgi:hypothetical protein